METIYIEGTGQDFVDFIHKQGDNAQIEVIDGFNRWVITREDGTKYIAKPNE